MTLPHIYHRTTSLLRLSCTCRQQGLYPKCRKRNSYGNEANQNWQSHLLKDETKKCLLQLNNFDIINESSRTMFILLWKYWEALCYFRFLKINVSCYIFNLSPPITGRMLRHWVKIVLHWYNLFIAQSDDKLPLQNPTQSFTTNLLLTKINIKQDPTCSFCQKPFRKPYPPLLSFENRSIGKTCLKKLKQCILRSTHYPIYLGMRPDTSKRNFCFLSVRHHIRSCRANNNIPLLASFLLPHKSHFRIESNNLNTISKKWNPSLSLLNIA